MEWILLLVAGWVGFRIVDEGNMFLGFRVLKEDIKDVGFESKEYLKTGILQIGLSKVAGEEMLIEQQLKCVKSGAKWESESFARDRARVKKIQEVHRPGQAKLITETKKTKESIKAMQTELDRIEHI